MAKPDRRTRPSAGKASRGLLVERERELTALQAAIAGARSGTGTMVLVEGAAGLGKSRLLKEVAGHARGRGMRLLQSRALATESEFPFAVALHLFEGALAGAEPAQRDALFDGAAGLARSLLSERRIGPERTSPSSLFSSLHGLYWLAVNLAALGPLAICVDDLHWSDEPSLQFLQYLAGRVEELPIALVMAARPPGAEGDSETLARLRATAPARRLGLRALGRDGVLSLVREILPAAEDGFCATCAEVTRGNPFYVHEVVRMLTEEGLAPNAGSDETVRGLAGAAIARAALSRLVRAGADSVALGRALAILGDGAPLRQAAALADLALPAAAAAADALTDEEVLAPGEPPTFTHPLVRDQIYREIPPQQCRVAHLHAARLLAGERAAPERVAAQLLLAPGSGEPWVVAQLREVAAGARARGAPRSAARYLQRALEEPPDAASRGAVLAELGGAEAASGSAAPAEEHLIAALELEDDPPARATIWRQLAGALAGHGRAGAAADALERAIAETGDGEDASALLADYLSIAVFEPGLRQRAFELVAPRPGVTPRGSTAPQRRLLAAMAMRSAQEAEPVARAIELAGRAWAGGALLDDEGPDGSGWLMVNWALQLAEDYTRAQAVTSATLDAARRVGSVHAFANASYHRGESCFHHGQLVDAQADAELAIEAGRSGWRRFLVGALVLKVNVLLERGELEAAAETLAVADDQEHGNTLEIASRLHAHGRLALARGRPADARRYLDDAGRWLSERLGAQHTVLPWRADAALAALATGDRTGARALIEPSLAAAERAGTGVLHGRRLRVLGLIEGGTHGIELLQRSVARLADTQAALEHAQALADLGGALRRAGRRADCRPVLQQALDRAHRLGARRLEAQAREELVATGLRPRRAPISGPDALTPGERRVAQLAADGLSNPRIAQALFVTPKTVEFHLRHVYRKLDIPGRTGLAAALVPPGPPGPEVTAKD